MVHFLIDASLPRRTGAVVRAYGHEATDVRDIGLGTAADENIADHARAHQWGILTADQDFGNVVAYPPADYCGIVVVRPPPDATGSAVLGLIERFLAQKDLVDKLPGHLAIVEPARIRMRPAL